MKMDKSRRADGIIIAILMLMLTLTACGKSEFGVSENTGKQMTVTAQNADKAFRKRDLRRTPGRRGDRDHFQADERLCQGGDRRSF